eukprot:TRINITY_DN60745_c0_g1_i1.p1 TRINITY_DN60745_c0_g1~~TRINITY_DN60745_c0_g1_i1.p1  ORF type:complete len:417 (-),score=83.52 TRINITY_DN60745_c0_g1_i1:167-1282(-)
MQKRTTSRPVFTGSGQGYKRLKVAHAAVETSLDAEVHAAEEFENWKHEVHAGEEFENWQHEECDANEDQQALTTWKYAPLVDLPFDLCASPSLEASQNYGQLQVGDIFQVVEEVNDSSSDVIFLRLADGRGWAFDRHPIDGLMCERVQTSRSSSDITPCETQTTSSTHDDMFVRDSTDPELVERLEAFYLQHNPAKQEHAAQIVRIFKHRLPALKARLMAEYGAEFELPDACLASPGCGVNSGIQAHKTGGLVAPVAKASCRRPQTTTSIEVPEATVPRPGPLPPRPRPSVIPRPSVAPGVRALPGQGIWRNSDEFLMSTMSNVRRDDDEASLGSLPEQEATGKWSTKHARKWLLARLKDGECQQDWHFFS